MLFLLIGLVAVLAFWFLSNPAWAPRPPDTRAISNQANQAYRDLRVKLRPGELKAARQFKAWLNDSKLLQRSTVYASLADGAAGFSGWLAQIADQELAELTQNLGAVTAELGYNLAWITEGKVNLPAEVRQAIEDAVVLYSISFWRAKQVQSEVVAFTSYQAWLAAPQKSTNQALGQKIFGLLLARGLTSVSGDHYLAPEKQRWAHLEQTIRTTAEKQPVEFNAVLREALALPPPTSAVISTPTDSQPVLSS